MSNLKLVPISLIVIITLAFSPSAEVSATERLDCFEDCEKQYRDLKRFARNGSPQAQTILGLSYKTGEIHGTVDNKSAQKWMKRAAKQRYAPAQYYLAQWYRAGFYTGINEEKAMYYLERASNQEYAPAQYQLGMIKLGNDEIEAGMELIKESANNGDPYAKSIMARINSEQVSNNDREISDNDKVISGMGFVTSSVEQTEDDVIRVVGSMDDPLFVFENTLDRIKDMQLYNHPSTTSMRVGGLRCGQFGSRCRVYRPNPLIDVGGIDIGSGGGGR